MMSQAKFKAQTAIGAAGAARPAARSARQRAAAVRRCKKRKRAGLSVLRIEVPLGPLADQLTQDRFLGEWDTENRLARAHEVID
jgi:hypothetical protein